MTSRRMPLVRAVLCATACVACSSWINAAEPAQPESPSALFGAAVRLFFADKPGESSAAFDRLVQIQPEAEPELWQRGLALYYAGRFADGQRQFELHRTVNPADVENVAWHFACVARDQGPEQARRAIIPVGDDRRVPMREILDLFAGRATPEAVLAAAEAGPDDRRRNQLCYAHLYLGLLFEATGDPARAKQHMLLAADRYSMDHYMGKVAQVHCRLRGWMPAAAATSARPPQP